MKCELILKDRETTSSNENRICEDTGEHGVPPHWMLFVAVQNANDTVAKAASLGATILAAPFDVFDVLRMAVIQDPTGAVFSLWQANKSIGIRLAGVPGSLCWADLMTPDRQAAESFYSSLFGSGFRNLQRQAG